MRRPVGLAVVAAALAAAAPAHASRFDLRLARFTATFEGERTVAWNEPRHQVGSDDCYHRTYAYGSGGETWKLRSKPAKLMFAQAPGSKLVVIHNGTWDPYAFGEEHTFEGVPGIITRNASRASGWQPGPCGGEPGLDPARDLKCGSRLPRQAIDLSVNRGKLIPSLSLDGTTAHAIQPFADCEIALPRIKPPDATQLPELGWPRDEIAGRVSIAALFGSRRTVTITGRRTWNDVLAANGAGTNGGTVSTSATFAWKLTLTRAKGTGRR